MKKFWPSLGVILILAIFITITKMDQKFGNNWFSENFIEKYNPKNYEIVDINFTPKTYSNLKRYFLPKNVIVKPETISHQNRINDVMIDKDRIYSVANDNTIRVWDRDNLSLKKVIYEKRNAKFGNLYTITSNNKYFLTAGMVGDENTIFVIDKKSLKNVKLIKNSFNAINKMVFNKNKTLLAISSGDNIYFYDKNLNYLYDKDFEKFSKKYNSIYNISFLTPTKIVFVTWDGYVIIFDVSTKKTLYSKKIDSKLQALDVIKNRIYVADYNGNLWIFDEKLNLKNKFKIPLKALVLAHNKKFIAVGGYDDLTLLNMNGKIITHKNINFCKALAIDDNYLYFGDRNIMKKVDLKNLNEIYASSEVVKKIYSLKDLKTDNYLYTPLDNNISLSYYLKNNKDKLSQINSIDGKIFSFDIFGSILEVSSKDFRRYFIRDNSSGYIHTTALWYKKFIVSGGEFGNIFVYDIYKGIISYLFGFYGTILDMNLNGNILSVLGDNSEVKFYNLKNLKNKIYPFMSLVQFINDSILIKKGKIVYDSVDLKDNAVCLKNTPLNLVKIPCLNTESLKKEKKPEIIDLNNSAKVKFSGAIDSIFDAGNYVLIIADGHYVYNKKIKKLKKIYAVGFISDVLIDKTNIYLLNSMGVIYKYDKNFNYIGKSDKKPHYVSEKRVAYHLEKYKDYIVSTYNNNLVFYDKYLNSFRTILIKKAYFWTTIDKYLFFYRRGKLWKFNLNNNKFVDAIKVDDVYIKTPQNRIVVRIKNNYYALDKNFKKQFLIKSKKGFEKFFKYKNNFYGVNDKKIVMFTKKGVAVNTYLSKDRFSGNIAFLDEYDVLFADKFKINKFDLYDFSKNSVKVMIKSLSEIKNLYTNENYILEEQENKVNIYDRNLTKIKIIPLIYNYERVKFLDGNTLYTNERIINLKTFKIEEISKKYGFFFRFKDKEVFVKEDFFYDALYLKDNNKTIKLFDDEYVDIFHDEKFLYFQRDGILYKFDQKLIPINYEADEIAFYKNEYAFYSKTDSWLYFKNNSVKIDDNILKIFISKDSIFAVSLDNIVFVYDKKLNLKKIIRLNKDAENIVISPENIIYYSLYGKIYKYSIL
jgi:hypothetical protein